MYIFIKSLFAVVHGLELSSNYFVYNFINSFIHFWCFCATKYLMFKFPR